MKRLCLPVLAGVLAGCGNTPPSGKPSWPGPDEQIGFVPPLVRTSDGESIPLTLEDTNRRNAEIFRRQNAAYALPMISTGEFVKVTPSRLKRRQTLLRTAGLVLDLNIGKATHTAPEGTNGWRTSSRYVLRTELGQKLAEAESIIFDDGAGYETDNGVSVFPDAATRTILIMEHGDVGTPRCIVFTARRGSAAMVRYVEVPLRVQASFSPMHLSLPNILGVRDGKVFLNEDGVIYAFPLGELKEVASLEFSLG